jgi:hypothetical protein
VAFVQEVKPYKNPYVKTKKRFKAYFSHDNSLGKESIVFGKKVAKIAKRIANKAK